MATWRQCKTMPTGIPHVSLHCMGINIQFDVEQQVPTPYAESRENEPVIAYVSMRLHEDGRFSMLTSDHVKDCASTFNSQGLQEMMLKAHQKRSLLADNAIGAKDWQTSVASAKTPVARGDRIDEAYQRPHYAAVSTPDDHCSLASQPVLTPTSVVLKVEDESEDEKPARTVVTRSFRIEEREKVQEFLINRLSRMQQTAVKRLAKAWIKGICPKKQAKFPYHDATSIPQWWPNTEDCPFREPDHIKKEKRLILCLHLLRLRPEHGRLQKWNGDPEMPHSSHKLDEWTRFLQLVAPVDVINDLRESEESAKHRVKYLQDLYKVAQLEEDYLNDAIDGSHTFTWIEDPADRMAELRRQNPAKRRTASTSRSLKRQRHDSSSKAQASKAQAQAEPKQISPREPDAEPQDDKPQKKKRKKCTRKSQATTPPRPTSSSQTQGPATASSSTTQLPMDCSFMVSYQENTPVEPAANFAEFWRQQHGPPPRQSTQDDALTASFSSCSGSHCTPNTAESFMADSQRLLPMSMGMQHAAPGLNNYGESTQPMQVPTHMVTYIPQPQFETVPNSPIMPHPTLLGLSMEQRAPIAAGTQPHPWVIDSPTTPQPYSYTSVMYDNHMCMLPGSQSAAPTTRSASDSLPFADIRQRESYLTFPQTLMARTDSHQQQAGHASYAYDTYSRPT